MRILKRNWRFLLVLLIVATTALFLEAHRRTEVIPKSERMSAFPMQVAGWSGRDFALEANTLASLGPGDFLNCGYFSRFRHPQLGGGRLNLFRFHREARVSTSFLALDDSRGRHGGLARHG